MKINKLSLPVTIIIASIILGGFYYVSQVNKQDSIERQQRIELEAKRQEVEAKATQEQKEYVAKRKGECYEIYEKEREKWNNVDGHFYNEEKDACTVKYENQDWKEGDPFFSGFVDEDGDGVKEKYNEGKYFTKDY